MYKIFKKEYYNEHGRIETTRFIIKKRKSFMGIAYWREVRHSTWAGNDPMQFNTSAEAKEFIRDILCPEVPREKWIETPIQDFYCK
jgi:hypothetical protein